MKSTSKTIKDKKDKHNINNYQGKQLEGRMKDEYVFFTDSDGVVKLNKVCLECQGVCKQSSKAIIFACSTRKKFLDINKISKTRKK